MSAFGNARWLVVAKDGQERVSMFFAESAV